MSVNSNNFCEQRTLCVIIGASRGLGKSIAINFAGLFAQKSLFVLTGRSTSKLEETKSEITKKYAHQEVVTLSNDLSTLDFDSFGELLGNITSNQSFDHGIIVHNAGSLTVGDRTYLCADVDAKKARLYYDMNVTSAFAINAVFMKYVTADMFNKRTVVNISSLAAIQPFKSWALYSSGKAARDMFFSTLAVEEPSMRVLTYAPGPCKTDMGKETTTLTSDEELRNGMESLFKDGGYLDCDTSVAKLIEIMKKDTYESGSHLDYYDEI